MAISKNTLSDFDRITGKFQTIPTAAWRRGTAISMLRETNLDEYGLDGSRGDRPQDNILARYVTSIRELGDAHVETAFFSVLSEFVASAFAEETLLGADDLAMMALAGGPVEQAVWA